MMQPIASDDVAALMADYALAPPVNGIVEIAGPEPIRMSDLAARFLRATHDEREVIADPAALYYGARVDDSSLTPGKGPRLGRNVSTTG